MRKLLTMIIVMLVFSTSVRADDNNCKSQEMVNTGTSWVGLQKEADEARTVFCQYMALPNDVNRERMSITLKSLFDGIFSKLPDANGDPKAAAVTAAVRDWYTDITAPDYAFRFMPYVFTPSNIELGGTLNNPNHPAHNIPYHRVIDAAQIAACNCRQKLVDLKQMFLDVYVARAFEYKANITKIRKVNAAWQSFLDDGREQTYFDIAATTFANRLFDLSNESVDFDMPPPVQWFLLRPNIVVENVAAAVDGDEISEAIAIEVIGANFWKEDSCGFISCGLSLTFNYADRAGVKSTGYGFMIHVDNKYSIGVSRYGGDTGVYATVDLLKLFQDNKATIDRYINSRK